MPQGGDQVPKTAIRNEAAAEPAREDMQGPPPQGSSEAAEASPGAPARPPATPASVFAGVTWLMTRSPRHRHLFLADLEWAVMPALQARQFRLFEKDGRPVAFVAWAFVSEEVEGRLKAGGSRLRPADWRSGDRCWIVELIAPFGGEAAVIEELRQTVLADQAFFLQRLDPETKKRRVERVEGCGIGQTSSYSGKRSR